MQISHDLTHTRCIIFLLLAVSRLHEQVVHVMCNYNFMFYHLTFAEQKTDRIVSAVCLLN